MAGLVFFGSGPVAAKSLELLSEDFEIEAVVTKPKPEHHRGSFPVLDVAEKLKLKLYTVSNKDELSKLISTKPFTSDLGVLIDFGIIIAKDTIDYFPKGIVNSHFSLLPEWRGADPITFAILSGQKQTGISLMLLVEKMDEGPILAYAPYPIPDGSTTTSLTEALIELSAQTIKDILPKYIKGSVMPEPQDTSVAASYSRKLTKEDGRIDWHKPAEKIEREIRAYAEWPKSYTQLDGKDVIITAAHVVPTNHGEPGEITVDKDTGVFMVGTASGSLCIDKLKPAGKKEMSAADFIRGYLNS